MKVKISTKQTIFAIAASVLILVIAQLAALLIGSLFEEIGLSAIVGNIASAVLYPIFAILGVTVLCNKLLKITLADCRITRFCLKPLWCVCAFVMPLSVLLVYILLGGHWENTSMTNAQIWENISASVFLYGLAGGIVEEMTFRGVIMSVLEYRCNKWIAIIMPSVLFGLLHILNIIEGRLDLLSAVQLVIAGSVVRILFSLITYSSQSIWNSALVHGVWNALIGVGIIHIGTVADESSIFNFVIDNKSFLISGGDFGIEASVVAIGVYLVFTFLAVLSKEKN